MNYSTKFSASPLLKLSFTTHTAQSLIQEAMARVCPHVQDKIKTAVYREAVRALRDRAVSK
jgi:hypothetical protein